MSANATMRAVREGSYQRLEEARAEARKLIATRDPRRARAALARIVRLGKRTLDEGDGIAGPSVLSHVRMQMAAALFDLAALEPDRERRAKLISAGARACDTSLRIALASGAPFLSLKIFPWGMVVLAGGLRAARDGQSMRLQRLMASCAKALPRLDAQARREGREAARALFRAQLLATAAEKVSDPAERGVVVRRAVEIAREARRRALGAGDFAVGKQAEATIRELESEQAPREAPARPAAKFCPNCGTPTRPGRGFCANCGSRLTAR